MQKTILTTCLLLLSTILLNSCGYHLGTNGNPQIKTIAIAPVKNDTYEIKLGSYMKNYLADRFHFDGAYKLSTLKNADAILYSHITQMDVTAANILTAPGAVTTVTKTFGISIKVEYTLVIPGRAQPVITPTQVTGTAEFQVPVDLFPARQEGAQQACRDAAQQIVSRCSEGW